MSNSRLINLQKAFTENLLPKAGVISLYGNYLGKPGDTISFIKEIKVKKSILVINLGKDVITIYSPKEISFNSSKIEITSIDKIYLNEKILEANDNEKAFVLYTW